MWSAAFCKLSYPRALEASLLPALKTFPALVHSTCGTGRHHSTSWVLDPTWDPSGPEIASSSATWGSGWKWWCPRRPHLWTSLILLEVPAQLLTAQTRPTLSGPGGLCVTSTRKMRPLGRPLYPEQARRGPQPIAGLSPAPWASNVAVLWKHIKFSISFD